ncbi:MAG: cation:proton antiporter [Chloroflexi bacterium]|nr:cation:proton antiporter [Chloroflexota bacterium]
MATNLTALILALLVFVASVISIEAGLAAAIIEITLGTLAGNFFGVQTTPWIDFLAGMGGILLTFLAGTEVNTKIMRKNLRESLLIGGVSFLAPFLAAFAFAYWAAGWTLQAAEIAGTALSTTSLAVVYAVLVETGLSNTDLGKRIMAATFVTDILTALALSILFIQINVYTILFGIVSIVLFVALPKIYPLITKRYGAKVVEPEIKFLFVVLFLFMWLGDAGKTHAALPVFVLGLLLSHLFEHNLALQKRLRVVGFAIITPFFFFKGGLNVGLSAIYANLGLLLAFLAVKLVSKFIAVFPFARYYHDQHGTYTTLLMSTGLTFGTISSLYGLQAGIIDQVQFSLLITTVILSAIVPTFVAQRWFAPSIGVEGEPIWVENGNG